MNSIEKKCAFCGKITTNLQGLFQLRNGTLPYFLCKCGAMTDDKTGTLRGWQRKKEN